MFENKNKSGKGWFEEKSVRNERGQFVAKKHSEALTRAQYAKDRPLCTIVCEPCGHSKKDEVDIDEIIEVEVDDKRNNKDVEKIDDKEDAEELKEVDTKNADKEDEDD